MGSGYYTVKYIMEIDHLFVFSDNHGEEADGLVALGFTEGSSRVHPGQGTVNRKFYVDNGFIEILWVQNEEEMKNGPAREISLWERSRTKATGASPFGLCLVNDETTDELFSSSTKYQPAYFPQGMAIDVLAHPDQSYLPWTFRLPYRGRKKHSEPTCHDNGIQKLTRATFEMPTSDLNHRFITYFQEEDSIRFTSAEDYHLIIEFDDQKQGKHQTFSELRLTITY